MKKSILSIFLLCFLASGSLAANWYVRPSGGSGSGTNWTTAWNGLDNIAWASVACGDTIWVAGGTYPVAWGPSKVCTAGSPLAVRRARADATECTGATGWDAGYDSLVNQDNSYISMGAAASYITISGRTTAGGGDYGWLVQRTGTSGNGIVFWNGADTNNITIEYMELAGPGGATATADARGIDDTPGASSSSHHTFSHLKIHDFESGMYVAYYNNHVSEYIDMYNIYGNGTMHPNLYYIITSDNGIIRNSKFHDSAASGTGIAFSDGGVFDNWTIYNNLFYNMNTASGTAISIQQSAANGLKIYSNTFDNNVMNFYPNGGGSCGTGSESKNNLIYGDGGSVVCGTSSNNQVIVSPDPFTNRAGGDYSLVAGSIPIDNGADLSAVFTTDILGTTRPQGSAWDIGAYEFETGFSWDTTPAAFSFTDNTNVPISTMIYSNSIQVTAIDNVTDLSLSGAGCEYAVNGGSWVSASDNVNLNDNIALRRTSDGGYSTDRTCSLILGGTVSDTWHVTTIAAAAVNYVPIPAKMRAHFRQRPASTPPPDPPPDPGYVGHIYPTAAQSVSESPYSNNGWSNPTYIYSAGEASITASTFDAGDRSFVLKAYGFDFSAIPVGATIDGVEVIVNARYGTAVVSISLAQLLDTARAKVGTNLASSPQALTTSAANYTYGGAANKWGNTLTRAWVQDADFGVALGFTAGSTGNSNNKLYVDSVTMKVWYTP